MDNKFIPNVYVYLRISTNQQDISNQESEIIKFCDLNSFNISEIVKDEGKSGNVCWKNRKIFHIVNKCRKGDVIIVPELSRIGRKMLEIMEILSICSNKGIKLFAVKGNFKLDDSLSSKIIAMGYSISAEIERNLISERTKAALQKKKDDGVRLGLPKFTVLPNNKLFPNKNDIFLKYSSGLSCKHIASLYSVSPSYMCRFIRTHFRLSS